MLTVSSAISKGISSRDFKKQIKKDIVKSNSFQADDIWAAICFSVASLGLVLIPLIIHIVYSICEDDHDVAVAGSVYEAVWSDVATKLMGISNDGEWEEDQIHEFNININGVNRTFRIEQFSEQDQKKIRCGFLDRSNPPLWSGCHTENIGFEQLYNQMFKEVAKIQVKSSEETVQSSYGDHFIEFDDAYFEGEEELS